MKRIYLFLAMLFAMFSSTAVFAQDDYLYRTPDGQYGLDDMNPLFTDGSQFSSPYSQNDLGGQDGGNIDEGVLIDDDPSTFWHSYWGGGNVTPGLHYFQVELSEPVSGLVAFRYVCRGADNDHTIKWSVRGTNNPDASKDACEVLALVETPNAASGKTCISDVFELKEYTYIRFYSEEQKGSGYGSRGYFHAAEFQLYPVVKLGEQEIINNMLYAAWEKYSPLTLYYPVGDTPGRYPAELLDAFQTAIDNLDADNNTPPTTIEGAEALIQACEDALAALQAAKVPFELATGYYRVVAGMMYDDGEDKYMGGKLENGVRTGIWGSADLNDDIDAAKTLWQITNNGDGTYDMVSMYHDGRFTEINRSAVCEMDPQSSSLMAFDLITTDNDGHTFVNIRVASQEADDFHYLHQSGHGDGGGSGGDLVGWEHTWDWSAADDGIGGIERWGAKASDWYFEPVDESEAQQIIANFEPYKNKQLWLDDFRFMLSDAKPLLVIAKDVQAIVEEDKPIVSDDNWITSPCSDSAEGQNIEYLWDGDGNTFWHTDWHGSFTAEDHHYLQVEIPGDLTSAVMRITRRNTTSGNQINKWTVWGTNFDDESMIQGDDGLEKLADLTTPYHAGNNTEVCTSEVFDTKGYQYLRFYCAGTCNNDGTQGGNEKFFHIAEFQLYPGHVYQSPTNQYAVMGDIATNLETLLAKYEDVDLENDVEYEDYTELKSAYDAFMAIFVDPTDLRDAILAANNKLKSVVIGTNPGFWTSDATSSLQSAVTDATAYNEAGAYTPSDVDNLIYRLESEVENIDGKAIPVQEGKWYRIRYGTEDEYAQYGWPTEGNGTDYWNNDEHTDDDEFMYNEAIYGKYMVPAKNDDVTLGYNDSGDEVKGHRVLPVAKEDVRVYNYIYADADGDIEDKDMSMWRFIKVADGYAIQNKATGLFMQKDGYMRAGLSPTVFTHLASGYGQNTFIEHKLESGDQGSPLHLARSYNVLTTWGSQQSDGVWSGMGNYDGRRACFFVEEVGDVAPDFTSADCKIDFTPGDIFGRCFPVSITVKDPSQGELWSVSNLEYSEETVNVTLVKITDPKVPAGRPFFYIASGDMPGEGEEYDPIAAEFGFDFNIITTPQTDSFLKGAFDGKTINERYISAGSGNGENALKFYDSGSSISNNRVYITPTNGEEFGYSAELSFTFDTTGEDGIQGALQNIARTGDIYTLDGRLIGKGNINDLKQKGVYIVNGMKVIVK